jgi:hypothetical protein
VKTILQITVGLVLLLFVSCGSSRKDIKEPDPGALRYRSIAMEKYGPGAEFLFNEARTAVVCLKKSKPTPRLPQKRVGFIVFDLLSDSIVFEDNIPNGSVDWKDNFSVLVNITPGTEKAEDVTPQTIHGYIYDIRIRKARELNSAPIQ